MTWLRWLVVVLVSVILLSSPQVSWAGNPTPPALLRSEQLPLQQAQQLAQAAIAACRQRDAAVSVSVVDPHGAVQVVLHDDHAVPHSTDLSRQKAYTAVSLAGLQQLHTTSELVEVLRRNSVAIGDLGLPAAPVQGITPLPGGVVIQWNGQVLAGLGVSGARQGQIDEACALEAEQQVFRNLDHGAPA